MTDIPLDIRQQIRELREITKALKEKGIYTKLKYNEILAEGKLYDLNAAKVKFIDEVNEYNVNVYKKK